MEMVVPTAPALGGVAAGPGAAAASVPRRAAARLRVTQLLRCARAQSRERQPRRPCPAHPGALPDRRRCAAAMPAVPGLGRERADVRASPRVIAACSPGAREGMIRRPPARRCGDVSRRPEPSPWLRPGLWRWAGTLCFYRGQIFARMLAVEAAPRRLLRGASTGLFGGRCCSRGGTRRACGDASDRVQSRYVMCSYVVALVMYSSGYRGPRGIPVWYTTLSGGRG